MGRERNKKGPTSATSDLHSPPSSSEVGRLCDLPLPPTHLFDFPCMDFNVDLVCIPPSAIISLSAIYAVATAIPGAGDSLHAELADIEIELEVEVDVEVEGLPPAMSWVSKAASDHDGGGAECVELLSWDDSISFPFCSTFIIAIFALASGFIPKSTVGKARAEVLDGVARAWRVIEQPEFEIEGVCMEELIGEFSDVNSSVILYTRLGSAGC